MNIEEEKRKALREGLFKAVTLRLSSAQNHLRAATQSGDDMFENNIKNAEAHIEDAKNLYKEYKESKKK